MQGQTTPRPVTASEIVAMVRAVDDRTILGIVATATEVLEAHSRLIANNQLGAELQRRPSGRSATSWPLQMKNKKNRHRDRRGATPAPW